MWDALTVVHLFKPNIMQWNESFIHHVLEDETALKILDTLLSSSVRVDTVTWRFEKNNLYSVRKAFRDIINTDATIMKHCVQGHWSLIWKLKLP